MSVRTINSQSGTGKLRAASAHSVDIVHDRDDEALKFKGADGVIRSLLAADSALRVAAGQHTTVDADDTVVTGLDEVTAVVAVLDDDPVDGAMHVTATIGDQAGSPAAGSVQIKTWKSTDADATLIAATTFGKKVNWIAIGT